MPIYEIVNLDDIVHNCNGFSGLGAHLKKLKPWIFYNFAHVDLEEYFSTRKLLGRVLKEKKVNYPKKVNFAILEPFYNKSYWLEVDYINDLNKPALVEAEIKTSGLISINIDNIGQLTLFLNRAAMKLGQDIQVQVNHQKGVIRIGEYSKVFISTDHGALKLVARNLTGETFAKEYASIVPREELLGIRQVYLKKCCIIKPDHLEKKLFERRLTSILQKPFKNNSIRNYKYDLFLESQTTPELLAQHNFIHIIDARCMNEFEQNLLGNMAFRIQASGLNYGDREYEGDYFALLSGANPFNNERQALLIIYNSETVQEELFNILNAMLFNPLFYCQAIIYVKGEYFAHRHGNLAFERAFGIFLVEANSF